jgi:hypothetical protein
MLLKHERGWRRLHRVVGLLIVYAYVGVEIPISLSLSVIYIWFVGIKEVFHGFLYVTTHSQTGHSESRIQDN